MIAFGIFLATLAQNSNSEYSELKILSVQAAKLQAAFLSHRSPTNQFETQVKSAQIRLREQQERLQAVEALEAKKGGETALAPRRSVANISPAARAEYARIALTDANSMKRYYATFKLGDLRVTERTILTELNSTSISMSARGEHLLNLAGVELRLGELASASKAVEAALPICPKVGEPTESSLLISAVIHGQQGKFYPGESSYVDLKFKLTYAKLSGSNYKDDPAFRRYLNISDESKKTMFECYLLLSEGVGGSPNYIINSYCAEKAVEMYPNNPAALLAYGHTHGRGIPLVVKGLIAIEEHLPEGDFKDYVDEYLSPGSTANRTTSRRHDTP